MTIKNLIEKLKDVPEDAHVYTMNNSGSLVPLVDVTKEAVSDDEKEKPVIIVWH